MLEKIKISITTTAILFFLGVNVIAEIPLGKGYGNLAWGANLGQVRKEFPSLRFEKKEGETVYYIDKTNNNIVRRFGFYKDKLYVVHVLYLDMVQSQYDALQNRLVETYGNDYLLLQNYDYIKFGISWELEYGVGLWILTQAELDGKKLGETVAATYMDYPTYQKMIQNTSKEIEL